MNSLILEEGLRDFIFTESDEDIESLNSYADQLISDNVDSNLELKIESILNKHLQSNINLFEKIATIGNPEKVKANEEAKGAGIPSDNTKVVEIPKTGRAKDTDNTKFQKVISGKTAEDIEKDKKSNIPVVKKKLKVKSKEQKEREEVKKISKAKGPLASLKRKMGGKSLGKHIKQKLLNTKKVTKVKQRIKKSLATAAKRARTKERQVKRTLEKIDDKRKKIHDHIKKKGHDTNYERMLKSQSMKLKQKAIKDKSKSNKLRRGIKTQFQRAVYKRLS